MVLGTFYMLATYVLFYLMTTFSLSFGRAAPTGGVPGLGHDYTTFVLMMILGVVFFGVFTMLSGPWADRWGRRRTPIVVTLGIIAFGVLWVPMLSAGPMGVMAWLILGFSLMGMTFGPIGALLPELFPANVSYTGSGIAYNMSSILGAAVAPFIAVALWRAGGGSPFWVGVYLSAMAGITLVALLIGRETRDVNMRHDGRAAATDLASSAIPAGPPASPSRIRGGEPTREGAMRRQMIVLTLALAGVALWVVAQPSRGELAWATGASYDCTRELHVAPSGSDEGSGSAEAPWRSISRALAAPLRPGDCITLADGIYTEAVEWARRGGTADVAGGYVVLRAANRYGAKLRPPPGAYSTLTIRVNFVVVDGLDVVGGEGHAIDIEDAHHVKALRNRVHDSGGSGISAWKGEFYWFEGNESFGNTATNGFQGSGISIYWARAVAGGDIPDGFRNVIRGNRSYDNVGGPAIPEPHTDGNGIIIDDFRHTQTEGVEPYPHATLVENNLVHGNGGKGIQVTWSDHVTVRNNTSWQNNLDNLNPGTWRGELSNAQSSHNVWVNNLAVADASVNPDNTAFDNTSYDGYVNEEVVWSHNLGFALTAQGTLVRTDGGNPEPDPEAGNLLGVDPRLTAPEGGNFALGPDSPAIDAGTDDFGVPETDLNGEPRVRGGAVDLGAMESGD